VFDSLHSSSKPFSEPLLPLPSLPSLPSNADRMHGSFWRPNEAFVGELSSYLSGKRVLEIFSGNGLLAGLLSARGVDVRATTLLSSHDSHSSGFFHPVEELHAIDAVVQYGGESDVLLVAWPTTTPAVLMAALRWGEDKPIVFIGEVTDRSRGPMGYGGCATDEFFDAVEVQQRFDTYKGNMLEAALVYKLK
jgi:hypothetical protein